VTAVPMPPSLRLPLFWPFLTYTKPAGGHRERAPFAYKPSDAISTLADVGDCAASPAAQGQDTYLHRGGDRVVGRLALWESRTDSFAAAWATGTVAFDECPLFH
jgi:hypothetical protein